MNPERRSAYRACGKDSRPSANVRPRSTRSAATPKATTIAALHGAILGSLLLGIFLICTHVIYRTPATAASIKPVDDPTLSVLANDVVPSLIRSFYAGHGLWRDCPEPRCWVHNSDWGSDALTNTLYLRWKSARDRSVLPIIADLAGSARRYLPPCEGARCLLWSDVPMWDAVTAVHEYEIDPKNSLALDKATAAFWAVEGSNVYDVGACPAIRYQRPFGRGDHLKTLESDSNGIKAAILLYEATHEARYLEIARLRYHVVRRYFLDARRPLYSVYVFDDGRHCRQLPHRYFASVNGNMIWNGLLLARLTGRSVYADQAIATARAVTSDLSDQNGVFADLQAENDIVEPLVEAMLEVTTIGDRGAFARTWLLRNATSASSDRRTDGTYGRFFDGPPPASSVTAWQTNGGFAIEIAAAALAPASTIRGDAWRNARFVARPIDRLPAAIRFYGSGIALVGTIGDVCCQPGRARIFVDDAETTNEIGTWQNKSSSGRRFPDSILFAWRWKARGMHRIRFEGGIYDAKEGGAHLRTRGFYVI